MKTILATAYAVNPYKGSEDGMGWNFIIQIARNQNVIAITRENNRESIEKYISQNEVKEISNIKFLYFDLPYWMRFWKKGSRGAMLYYLLWQKGIVSFVKKQDIDFDIVHNLNFHNDWTPSFLYKLGKPMVWGPIGHHTKIPEQYLKPYKSSYLIKDTLTWLIKKYYWNVSLNLKATIKNSSRVLAMNRSVAKQIPNISQKTDVIPSVATQDLGFSLYESDSFHVISAGRFVPLKGFDLTILSFAKMILSLNNQEKEKTKLFLVGSGPEENFLKSLVLQQGIEEHVKFIQWIPRDELLEMYKKSAVFLFPSHEGAGMVVAEALSFGLPVICLDNDGPGEFVNEDCGFKVPLGNYDQTVDGLSGSLELLYRDSNLRKKMGLAARNLFEQNFSWEVRGEQLKKIYEKL